MFKKKTDKNFIFDVNNLVVNDYFLTKKYRKKSRIFNYD